MSNFDQVMELVGEADAMLEKVDESFQRMARGGSMNMAWGMNSLVGNLKKANKLFKKLDKLTKEGGDTYTDEEKQKIEAKAKELTAKYNNYYQLIDKAADIAKDFVKAPIDAAKGVFKRKPDAPNEQKQEGEG